MGRGSGGDSEEFGLGAGWGFVGLEREMEMEMGGAAPTPDELRCGPEQMPNMVNVDRMPRNIPLIHAPEDEQAGT